ncbi:MAG: hypothetical protein EBT18_08065 [Gammaproteobacteria bacterium]|nr:hypothetical protein [Gammaproteobacteria bacterium]
MRGHNNSGGHEASAIVCEAAPAGKSDLIQRVTEDGFEKRLIVLPAPHPFAVEGLPHLPDAGRAHRVVAL